MIACINPQSADYDESISVLGNASLACDISIKEVAQPAAQNGRPALVRKGTRSSVSSRGSVSSANSGANASNQAISAQEPNKKRKGAPDEGKASAETSKIECLQKQIESLKATNKELIDTQFEREQEIRMEVCAEMEKIQPKFAG